MNTERESGAQLPNGHGSLVALALLALVVGATTGLICAGFRTALEHADRFRDFLIGWAHGHPIPGFVLVMVACSLATFLAAWLVFRLAPHAVGSGIPHVEVVLRGQLPPAPYGLGAVKFAGGILSIGAGLALGRSPLARNSEVQLAPITPVLMMAMRRMGLVLVMSCLRSVH